MRLIFLGTGTSTGVPQIGCTCPVCTSKDIRDNRLRTSALLVTDAGTRILFDCSPDFRQQMLCRDFHPLDAVLITHEHYDHVGGLDDLRPFGLFGGMHIYAEPFCLRHLKERLPYCFAEHLYPGVPRLELRPIEAGEAFFVKEQRILPLRVMHGRLPIVGFRVNDLAYITDMSSADPADLSCLQGVRTLVVNGLRFEPHASHQTVDEAIELSRRLSPSVTYLIHMSHHVGLHAEVEAALPPDVHLAYDGLEIDC